VAHKRQRKLVGEDAFRAEAIGHASEALFHDNLVPLLDQVAEPREGPADELAATLPTQNSEGP
jgi:hypothetical protein